MRRFVQWPAGLHQSAGSQPVPVASSATWRIPVVPIERYRPLVRAPILDGVAQATVSGAGAATVQVGPHGAGTRWYPKMVNVNTTTGVNDSSTFLLYLGTQSLATLVNGTSYLGGGDTIGVSGLVLQPGDFLIGVWAAGHSGDTATLVVQGEQVVMVA